jgi:hypothetical protein
MDAPDTRQSWNEIYPILVAWDFKVRLELHSRIYDGIITEISREAETLAFATLIQGERKTILNFHLAYASFERFINPGDWDEVLLVFPRFDPWFILRKWK